MCCCCKQELRVFLEEESELCASSAWHSLQPSQQTLLEGAAKLPKQIFGKEGVPQPTEVAQPTKKSNDLMRMMREGVQGIKNEWSAALDMPEEEQQLRYQTKLLETMWDQLSDSSRVVCQGARAHAHLLFKFL